MANEVATVDKTASSIEILPPAQPPSLAARQMLVAHAEMMNTAYDLADKMCRTELIPARFRNKPDDATAAILYGAELGLNPIQSLQRIIPIYGMPTLEARTMVGLLKSRGYKVRTREQSDTSVTVEGVDLDGEEYESTWTIERATKAKYVPEIDEKTGKYRTNSKGNLLGNEKYLTDPQAMLKAKAQAEVCRDMAPDILLGISYTAEEMDSERFNERPTPAARPASAPITVEEIFNDDESPRTCTCGTTDMFHETTCPVTAPGRVTAESSAEDEAEPVNTSPHTDEAQQGAPLNEQATPADDEPKANRPQLQKLSILRQREGYADTDEGRTDWFRWIEVNIGRLVSTNKDLSKAEAHVLIDVLESAQAQDERN